MTLTHKSQVVATRRDVHPRISVRMQRMPRVGPHADVAVGAVLFAQAAADAVVFDFDFVPFAAVNGVDRAADQAVGIFARPASAGDQVFTEPQSFALQPRDAAVGVGAGFRAFIATSAAFQIEHQQLLSVEQTLIEVLAEVRVEFTARLARSSWSIRLRG